MLKQAIQEKASSTLASFPSETESAPPFHYEHYTALHPKHKEQTVFTYIPKIRGAFNGDGMEFDKLPREERFQIYERMMFGFVGNLAEEIERAKTKLRYLEKVEKTQKKQARKISDILESKEEMTAEELRTFLPPKMFARLMLYVKYAGNNKKTLRAFFKNLEKEK